ncbi:MAG: RimJ/RimL family protein N-acetyltransferase [Kiritimatiellia bacterium]|jgi:RimJ/RimL family protein N-acetyltransferase
MNEVELGKKIHNWQAPPLPAKEKILGCYCYLEPLSGAHTQDLWDAYASDTENKIWRYLPNGPFDNIEQFADFITSKKKASEEENAESVFYAIVNISTNKAMGYIAYARIQAAAGSIEVAHVCFSPLLQKTTIATEAIYLMIDNSFHLGYRRCEWKCNSLNANSIKAAKRLGFVYEGCFRQATVVKGRNRNTSWFSIIDSEWAELRTAYLSWLATDNFDVEQRQKQCLSVYINQQTSHKI